jgi:ParB/RepB/Spo0J family partition protein
MLIKKVTQPTAATLSSVVKVYDIDVNRISLWLENPNVQDDKTFDILVDKIRTDGFDEPVHVAKDKDKPGWYIMVSGEHRLKAAKLLRFKTIPAVIHEDWDEVKRDIEGMARNNLRGTTDPVKFVALYDKLKRKGIDDALIKAQMGFTKQQAFAKLYNTVEKSVTPSQRKKLQEAKETIRSVDDLSSILNNIFKENGTELDHGFLVFSYGGKKHHYVPIDKETDELLTSLEKRCEEDRVSLAEVFTSILKQSRETIEVRNSGKENSNKKAVFRKAGKNSASC